MIKLTFCLKRLPGLSLADIPVILVRKPRPAGHKTS